MNHLVQEAGLEEQISCDSAGTASYHIGNPPDRRMVQAARARGLVFRGQARQFIRADFDEFDLILAMDRDNYRNIRRLDPTGQHQAKVKLMCEFCTQSVLQEVPDPYYDGPAGFETVLDLLFDACGGLLKTYVRD